MLIQEIVTRWTKASRGAPQAVGRNRVPEGLAFPEPFELPAGWWGYHRAIYDECTEFERPSHEVSVVDPSQRSRVGLLELCEEATRLCVFVRYDLWRGMPARDFPGDGATTEAFELERGEMGRVCYCWRSSHAEDTWSYQKTVVNIGNVEVLRADFFVGRTADKSYSDMPDLW